MASSIERALLRFQDNRIPIAKWAAIVAFVWAGALLVMALYIPTIFTAVRYSMFPVFVAAVAWGTARSVRRPEARKTGLFAMGVVWFCVIVVFVSQVQYYRLVNATNTVAPSSQTQQTE